MILNHLIEYIKAMLVKTHNIGEDQQRLKKHFVQVLFGLLIVSTSYAQNNLVSNAGFETYTTCPKKLNNYLPPPWYNACHNAGAHLHSCCTDIYASVPLNYSGGPCFQYAHKGGGYIYIDHINGNFRFYAQVQLNSTMIIGKKYYAEYYVNSPNSQTLACNNVGMLFTDTAVFSDPQRLTYNVIPASPQILNYGNPIIGDTLNWIKVSGIFTAHGGEQYLTLGNFKDDAHTQTKQIVANGYVGAGYYIDDVLVTPLDSFCLQANAGRDTTIKVTDSVFIGSYTNGIDSIKWYNSSGQVINSVQPGFWVKPNATGSYMYIVEQTVNGCYSRDTVYVNVVLPLRMLNYELRMMNEKEVLNKWTTANELNVHHYNIERSTNGKDFEKVGSVKANNKSYNEYNFTDLLTTHYSLPTTLYYRITGVDNDGRKTFSQIKNVELSIKNDGINVFPNPAKDVVHISSKTGIREVKIINAIGQVVYSSNNINHLSLNINHYPKGLYIVQTSSINKIENIKLVVE